MILANLGHDLNSLSKGRFALGLGTWIAAHIAKRFSMPWSHPAPRMREMIRAMQATWDTCYDVAKLDFHGEYYTHTLMTHHSAPLDIHHRRPKTALAAEVAAAMLCHAFTTLRYLREVNVPMVETTLAEKVRDRAGFEIVATMFTAGGDTDEQVHKACTRLRTQVSFYGSTPA